MKRILDLIKNTDVRPLIIGIDGMCASGKTTLAERLMHALDAPVIHTDDFFIPIKERTGTEKVNIDEKRFVNEVIMPLCSFRQFRYGVFDCKKQLITSYRDIPRSDIYIIEGSYCLYPCFPDIYAMKVFSEMPEELQRGRLIARAGEDGYAAFRDRWIPLENKYFKEYKIKERCDVVI